MPMGKFVRRAAMGSDLEALCLGPKRHKPVFPVLTNHIVAKNVQKQSPREAHKFGKNEASAIHYHPYICFSNHGSMHLFLEPRPCGRN